MNENRHTTDLSLKYRPDIDGLRAVAVLSVIGYHAFPAAIRGGFVGVDIFFVISGYLISDIIISELQNEVFTYKKFYRRRIRRIFPALTIVLATSLMAGWFTLGSDDYAELGKQVAAASSFSANYLYWTQSGYFDKGGIYKPLLHLWSLAVEEQFYIFWPLIIALSRKQGKEAILRLVVLVSACSFLYNLYETRTDPSGAFYLLIGRVWEFAIGGVVAIWCVPKRILVPFAASVFSLLGLFLLVAAIFFIDGTDFYPGWRALIPTMGTALVIGCGTAGWGTRNILSNRIAVRVGLISYPLYLWHWPLLFFGNAILDHYGEPELPAISRMALVLSAFPLASLTYKMVEQPFRFGKLRSLGPNFLSSTLVILFGLSCLIWSDNGIPTRAVNNDPKNRFIQYYDTYNKIGYRQYYHVECSFYDSETKGRKASIAASCSRPGPEGTWFLWGDSHAQALSYGLQSILPQGVALAQVATAGCPPSLQHIDQPTPGDACNVSNEFASAQIKKLQPSVLILVRQSNHQTFDWISMAKFAKGNQVKHVFVLGPVPQWRPSLPLVIARQYWGVQSTFIASGLDPAILETDTHMIKTYKDSEDLVYVSLIQKLCNEQGCLAHVPGAAPYDLLVSDSGHLSPEGSLFIASTILAKVTTHAYRTR